MMMLYQDVQPVRMWILGLWRGYLCFSNTSECVSFALLVSRPDFYIETLKHAPEKMYSRGHDLGELGQETSVAREVTNPGCFEQTTHKIRNYN